MDPISSPKKPLLKRWWFWVIIILILGGGGIGGFRLRQNQQFEASKTAKFITASPLDLNQINKMSPFRSCMGHDYRGNDRSEPISSMKHYVQPLYNANNSTVNFYAPFDGKIVVIDPDTDGNLALAPDAFPSWTFEFGHFQPAADLKKGSKVKAGQQIGTVAVKERPDSFDVAIWNGGNRTNPYLGIVDSIFNHMTSGITQEFANHGLTLDNMIITKEYRQAHACPLDQNAVSKKPGEDINEVNFAQVENDEGLMVLVKH